MQTFIQSLSFVAIAEMGDKTQILSIILATRFKRFWPICLGILTATLVNHAIAASAGHALADHIDGFWLKMATSISFIATGFWLLVPDKAPVTENTSSHGAFLTSMITFFIAEMGDKTQFATITLGAQYSPLWQVIAGTTAGMMLANIPAILMGERISKIIPLNTVRICACLLFVSFGVYDIWQLLAK